MPIKLPFIVNYETAEDALYGHKSSWSPAELKALGYRVGGLVFATSVLLLGAREA